MSSQDRAWPKWSGPWLVHTTLHPSVSFTVMQGSLIGPLCREASASFTAVETPDLTTPNTRKDNPNFLVLHANTLKQNFKTLVPTLNTWSRSPNSGIRIQYNKTEAQMLVSTANNRTQNPTFWFAQNLSYCRDMQLKHVSCFSCIETKTCFMF